MQIAQRKTKILKAIVEAYIKNGEPVGSKLLCNVLDFPVSSATVRNEMAELSELGFLKRAWFPSAAPHLGRASSLGAGLQIICEQPDG